jgi:hypothetical protein
MDAQIDTTSSIGDVITGAAEWLVALGMLTMALFPLAIPGIVLAAAVVVPLGLLALVAGLLAAAAAAPAMAVRRLRRRAAAHRGRVGSRTATARAS